MEFIMFAPEIVSTGNVSKGFRGWGFGAQEPKAWDGDSDHWSFVTPKDARITGWSEEKKDKKTVQQRGCRKVLLKKEGEKDELFKSLFAAAKYVAQKTGHSWHYIQHSVHIRSNVFQGFEFVMDEEG